MPCGTLPVLKCVEMKNDQMEIQEIFLTQLKCPRLVISWKLKKFPPRFLVNHHETSSGSCPESNGIMNNFCDSAYQHA